MPAKKGSKSRSSSRARAPSKTTVKANASTSKSKRTKSPAKARSKSPARSSPKPTRKPGRSQSKKATKATSHQSRTPSRSTSTARSPERGRTATRTAARTATRTTTHTTTTTHGHTTANMAYQATPGWRLKIANNLQDLSTRFLSPLSPRMRQWGLSHTPSAEATRIQHVNYIAREQRVTGRSSAPQSALSGFFHKLGCTLSALFHALFNLKTFCGLFMLLLPTLVYSSIITLCEKPDHEQCQFFQWPTVLKHLSKLLSSHTVSDWVGSLHPVVLSNSIWATLTSSRWFAWQGILAFFPLYWLVEGLYYVPLGKMVHSLPIESSGATLNFRANAFVALFLIPLIHLSLINFAGFNYFAHVRHYIHSFMTGAMLHALSQAVIVSIRSGRPGRRPIGLRPYQGNWLMDIVMGRELFPRIGPIVGRYPNTVQLDLKWINFRVMHVSALVCLFAFYLQPFLAAKDAAAKALAPPAANATGLSSTATYALFAPYLHAPCHAFSDNPNLTLLFFCQFLYQIWFLFCEETKASAGFMYRDTLGYAIFVLPILAQSFAQTLPVRYLAEWWTPAQVAANPSWITSWWYLGLCVALSISGTVLLHYANDSKHHFKHNPSYTNGQYIEVVTTTGHRGRIMLSGVWSFCRHPNYLGDIITIWSWSLFCGFGSGVPYIPAIILTLLLLSFVYQAERVMKEKYGSAAWGRYCAAVPYRLIPHLY